MTHADGNVVPLRPIAPIEPESPPEEGSEPERARLFHSSELREPEQLKWYAKLRILFAAISILVGPEGTAKSLFWGLLVAASTRGWAIPELGIPARAPSHVIIVATEDSWSTISARLTVAGADLNYVSLICVEADGSGAPTFPADSHLITDAAVTPSLVVVDMWADTVPSNLNVRDVQHARRALHPWREIATKTGAAVLLLAHTNRSASGDARDRYGATSELRKKARSALFSQLDEEDEGCILIGVEKSNAAGRVPATKFRIEAVQHFPPTDEDDGTVPKLVIVGQSNRTMREHIAESAEDAQTLGDGKEERIGAQKWLHDYLSIEGPHVRSVEVKRAGEKEGYSKSAVSRAQKALGVLVEWKGMPASTVWSLPPDSAPASP